LPRALKSSNIGSDGGGQAPVSRGAQGSRCSLSPTWHCSTPAPPPPTSQKCVVVTEAGTYLRLIDSCITQLKAQGPSRTCNKSKEEDTKGGHLFREELNEVFVASRRLGTAVPPHHHRPACPVYLLPEPCREQPCAPSGPRETRSTAALEATQGQILSQSPTDATRLWWHLYGS